MYVFVSTNNPKQIFVHIFTTQTVSEHFSERTDFMTANFFTGGTLPHDALLLYFQAHLRVEGHWVLSGTHYQRTQEAWLARMDENKESVLKLMAETYGARDALKWFVYWRLFFM